MIFPGVCRIGFQATDRDGHCPIFRGEEVVYDLSFNPPLEIFQRIIEQQKLSDDWTISIFDQKGIDFARVPNPARRSAKPVRL